MIFQLFPMNPTLTGQAATLFCVEEAQTSWFADVIFTQNLRNLDQIETIEVKPQISSTFQFTSIIH